MKLILIGTSLAFIAAIILSFVPVYVFPTSRVRIYGTTDEHDKWIYRSSLTGRLLILILLLFLASPIWYSALSYLWSSRLGFFLLLYILFMFFLLGVFCFLNKLADDLSQGFRNHHSIRPLRCVQCRGRMKALDRLSTPKCLSRQEKVAAQLGSINFEAWHCRRCCVSPEQDSIHLRAYVLATYAYLSNRGHFKLCPSCQEITMTSTTRVIEEVTYDGGTLLHVYICRCCFRTEEHLEEVPARDVD